MLLDLPPAFLELTSSRGRAFAAHSSITLTRFSLGAENGGVAASHSRAMSTSAVSAYSCAVFCRDGAASLFDEVRCGILQIPDDFAGFNFEL